MLGVVTGAAHLAVRVRAAGRPIRIGESLSGNKAECSWHQWLGVDRVRRVDVFEQPTHRGEQLIVGKDRNAARRDQRDLSVERCVFSIEKIDE